MKRNLKGNVTFLVLALLLLFVGGYFQSAEFKSGIFITEAGLVLIPAIFFSFFMKEGSLKEFFRLRKISLKTAIKVAGITFLTYPVAVFGNLLVITLLHSLGYEYNQAVPVAEDMGTYLQFVFLIGLMPGICEEMLFRGYFLRAYQEKGVKESVIYTAFLFGIFHFNLFNFMGPFILAIVFGYMTLMTGSIIPAIIGHVVNNTFSVTMGYVIMMGVKSTGQDIESMQNASLSVNEYLYQLAFWGIFAGIALRLLVKKMKKLKGNTSFISDDHIYKSSGAASHIPIILAVILYIYMGIKTIAL